MKKHKNNIGRLKEFFVGGIKSGFRQNKNNLSKASTQAKLLRDNFAAAINLSWENLQKSASVENSALNSDREILHFPLGNGKFSFLHSSPRYKPARAYEKHHGIKGVAGNYRLPEGLSGETLELYLVNLMNARRYSPEFDALFQKTSHLAWKIIKEMNSSLKDITPDPENKMDAYHCVLGVTSQFHPQDIADFVNIGTDAIKAQPDYENLHERICLIGGRPEWIPSYATLIRIDLKLRAKNSITPYRGNVSTSTKPASQPKP